MFPATWSSAQTVLVVIAVIIAIVLIVMMSTRAPGPGQPPEDAGADDKGDSQETPEVADPDAI